jgi:hypothetical protein
MVGNGVAKALIKETVKYRAFSIEGWPKCRSVNTDIAALKPKMHYIVSNSAETGNGCVVVYGGYGRRSTSFSTMFSTDQYLLSPLLTLHPLVSPALTRRLVAPGISIPIDGNGKFTITVNPNNPTLME